MPVFQIPYGHQYMSVNIPSSCKIAVAESGLAPSVLSENDIVKKAMDAPIGSPHLTKLAEKKRSAVIIISDHTRPVPSRVILPHMLEQLRAASPDIDITLLVATGCHRGTTQAELKNKLGAEIFNHEKIVVHDCDMSETVYLGDMPSGAPCMINRLAAETELLLAEGFIEPHFFAGFSGGRKSVMPGISDRRTVLGNHCAQFIASPFARTGILENNPIHTDMSSAAQMAKLAYILNVVIDKDKKVVAAFAGDAVKAHAAGCEYLKGQCSVAASPADIVITGNGGEPFDQNIYQCVKCMTAAEAMAREGGTIIVCGNCSDNIGGEMFYNAVKNCSSIEDLEHRILQTPMDKTVPDQWQYQILCRILKKHRVIFVTRPDLQNIITDMKMEYADSADNALEAALLTHGKSCSVSVIPNGIEVIVASA